MKEIVHFVIIFLLICTCIRLMLALRKSQKVLEEVTKVMEEQTAIINWFNGMSPQDRKWVRESAQVGVRKDG